MRSLRHLIRRSGLLGSDTRRRRSEKSRRGDATHRRLTNESLEKRELLAGDISHNYWNRYDVNDDGQISARDALGVINYMSRGGEAEQSGEDAPTMFYDVNGDNIVTASDALGVINAMSRGEEVGELVELLLTARDDNDDPLPVDANGDVNVDVGQIFNLEVAYDDLRLFNERLGAFQLFTDIAVDMSGVLSPVLNETQRLRIDSSLTSAPFASSLTFTIENSTATYVSDFIDFANNSRGEVVNALTAFGYSSSQYELTSVDFSDGDLGFQIHWVGNEFGNVDLPNISVDVNETTGPEVVTSTEEFAPFLADGVTPNTAAVRFNLNTHSRTFNQATGGDPFYTSQNRGAFDANGYTGVGGLGQVPSSGGGIPQLSDDGLFIEPFDAFSLRVFVNQPVTDLVVSVDPGEDTEATLLYGRDDPVPQDNVLIDTPQTGDTGTNGVAFVVINATGANRDPVVTAPVTATFSENDASSLVNLLANSSDLDNDTLNVAAVTLVSGDASGISVSGNSLSVTPSAYSALNAGQSETIIYNYNVDDGNGGVVATSATVTINGANDVNQPPVVSGPVTAAFDETDASGSVNLLANSTDPESDPLAAASVTLVSGDASGVTVNGNSLDVDPSAYVALDAGQTETIVYSYNVQDGQGGSVPTSATITINGENQAPVVSGPVTSSFFETDAASSVSLLGNASDADGDTLNAASVTLVSGDSSGVTVNGNSLDVDPSAYTALDSGQSETIIYNFNVIDGNGGSVSNSATITINGVNDANLPPVVSAPVTQTFTEDDAAGSVNLLANASDPNNDTLNVASVTVVSGNSGGITVNGNSLDVTPGFYGALDTGEQEVVIYSYNVEDGNGGSVSTTATVTITGITDNRSPVVSGPVTETFSEEDAAGSVDLLDGASDPDDDSLTVANVTVTSGDGSGITPNGNTLDVDPSAYGSLTTGDTEQVVYTYTISDGITDPISQTATVTITGVNDPPVARDDTGVLAFVGTTTTISVLDNDDAGDGEVQDLTVTNASSSNGAVTINANGTLGFTPTDGFLGNTTISYTIQDEQGATDSATVFVSVQDFNPSTISGAVFIDHVENLDDVINLKAEPIRNGVKDAGEKGLGGVTVYLVSSAEDNATGQVVSIPAVTDIHGAYDFENVAPGSYEVVYDVPDTVIYIGVTEKPVNIGSAGGVDLEDVNFPLLGTQGSALSNVDILASSYLRTNATLMQITDGGREGGLVSLDASGDQDFIILGSGYENVVFAELVLNDGRDAALLTILEDDGDLLSARLSSEHFVVSKDGLGVQFFGGTNDLDFVEVSGNSLTQEFSRYRNAVDDFFGNV